MVGHPHAGAWITGTPPPHATTPRGGPVENFESPGMMGANDGWAHPRRDATNMNPPPSMSSPLGGYP